jgi:hypothetical protein
MAASLSSVIKDVITHENKTAREWFLKKGGMRKGGFSGAF